jgi:hypothetical protein
LEILKRQLARMEWEAEEHMIILNALEMMEKRG